MNLQLYFQKVCGTFLTIWMLSFAIRIPTSEFNLLEFLQGLIPPHNKPGLTYFKERPKIRPILTSSPEECNRPCYLRARPKTCYYDFHIESYTTVGGACKLCSRNATNNCQCILADGVDKTVIVVNRQLPGPSIQVCKEDNLIIDVHNQVEGVELSIHWHGILQHNSQYYDGVPMVTQCAINSGTVFRYKWKAQNSGTHFWHSHSGFYEVDGLAGAIIVREPMDIHQRLYDYDNTIMMIGDWFHELGSERFPGRLTRRVGQDPDNVLINGKGQYTDPITNISTDTPLEVFYVERGKRYRFRLINGFVTTCPNQLYIEGHRMQIIATDGESVEPVIVDSITTLSAERYDFVLYADQPVGTYWIQVRAKGFCGEKELQQLAILKYTNGPDFPTSPTPTYSDGLPAGVVMNPLDGDCSVPRSDAFCIDQLQSAYRINPRLLKKTPDVKLFLPFVFADLAPPDVFKPNTFDRYLLVLTGDYLAGLIDGISFESPSSPLLSQYLDNDPKQFCDGDTKFKNCGNFCVCTHKIDVPLNAVVEVCLIDEVQVPFMYHPFHLHGHTFFITGMGHLPNVNESISLEKAIALDVEQGLRINGRRPPGKDTIPVPNNGYACFRFIADNPGFWLFHCHFLYHLGAGMALVFHVGERYDLPPVPKNFPKCGNFLPDLY